MPTASTSQILGNNECFEPITSNIYTRRTLAGEFVLVNKYLIDDLIKNIDHLSYRDEQLAVVNYAVVGQLCVDKKYRGQGLASKLYQSFKDHYSIRYPYCITDVDRSNKRSLQAHYKTGFQPIGQLQFENADFEIVLWNWNL